MVNKVHMFEFNTIQVRVGSVAYLMLVLYAFLAQSQNELVQLPKGPQGAPPSTNGMQCSCTLTRHRT